MSIWPCTGTNTLGTPCHYSKGGAPLFNFDKHQMQMIYTLSEDPLDSSSLMSSLKLSRKQYYDRMKELTIYGIVTKVRGLYFLTTFGIYMLKIIKLIELGEKEKWRFDTIDASPSNLRAKISEVLLKDYPTLREMLE